MTLSDIRDFAESALPGLSSYTIGRIDATKEQALCVYSRPSEGNHAVGAPSTYQIKHFCILLRYGKSYSPAEAQAQQLYDAINDKRISIGENTYFAQADMSEPVPLGVDDKGVYEFTIEFRLLYKEG